MVSHKAAPVICNAVMKTIEQIRRHRLDELAKEFGSLAALNERLGNTRTDSTLSQIRTQPAKFMGSDIARRLESVCGKEVGWMDNDPSLWPFQLVDHGKLMSLPPQALAQIQFGLLSAAAMVGVDIEKRTGTG